MVGMTKVRRMPCRPLPNCVSKEAQLERSSTLLPLPPPVTIMSYKRVVEAKRTKREDAIRETAALTTRELTKEDHRIVSSSGTCNSSIIPSSSLM